MAFESKVVIVHLDAYDLSMMQNLWAKLLEEIQQKNF